MCEKWPDFAERFKKSVEEKKTLSCILAQTDKSDIEKLKEYYNTLVENDPIFREYKNVFASINMSTREIVDFIVSNWWKMDYEYAKRQSENTATRVLYLLENFENWKIQIEEITYL